MKDKTARIIAIIALVFMAVFVVSLCLALAGVLGNVFMYVAIGSGAVALALFVLIKMSGRGYSITEMNNEIEMEKIRKENEKLIEEENSALRSRKSESENKENN